MKVNIIYLILLSCTFISEGMEKPHVSIKEEKPSLAKDVTKKELITLIEAQNAHLVLTALQHQNAAKVIDQDVLEIAQNAHTHFLKEKKLQESAKLSKTWSIILMLNKYTPSSKSPADKGSIKSHKHRSSKKSKERSPKEKMERYVKKRDLDKLKKILGTSSAHFVDHDLVQYAYSKYEHVLESSKEIKQSESKEYQIWQLLKQYKTSGSKERRRSCMIRSSSKKEERP